MCALKLTAKRAVVSCDHRQLGACELFLEEPVAHVDCQIDLLALDNLDLTLVFLHVDSDELVADFRGVFSAVYVTEWLLLQFYEVFWLQLCVVFLALPPADLVQALSEEDHESQHSLVELVVNLL